MKQLYALMAGVFIIIAFWGTSYVFLGAALVFTLASIDSMFDD